MKQILLTAITSFLLILHIDASSASQDDTSPPLDEVIEFVQQKLKESVSHHTGVSFTGTGKCLYRRDNNGKEIDLSKVNLSSFENFYTENVNARSPYYDPAIVPPKIYQIVKIEMYGSRKIVEEFWFNDADPAIRLARALGNLSMRCGALSHKALF